MLVSPKLALTLLLVPAGIFGARWLAGSPCCPGAPAGEAPGRYVEARSASVFAGACHYNGEYTTQGREEVLCFVLGDVSHQGQELRGVELVVAVAGDRNLKEAGVARRSVVYLDEQLDSERASAAVAWLESRHAGQLGQLVALRRGAVSVRIEAGEYSVRALDAVRLEGQAMPDRACCSMPSNVWYEPEVELAGRLVGLSSVLAIDEPALGLDLERHEENNAFVGCLPAALPAEPACCSSLPRP